MDIDPAEIAYVPTTGVRRVHEAPLVAATEDTLKGYGHLVHEPKAFPIEIKRWPAQGWRPIDANFGDQGGVTEGIFDSWWSGETLYARNGAVGDATPAALALTCEWYRLSSIRSSLTALSMVALFLRSTASTSSLRSSDISNSRSSTWTRSA